MNKSLPDTQQALVLRTDFSDEDAWKLICMKIQKNDQKDGFQADVECVSDTDFEGLSVDQIPKGSKYTFIFIVNDIAITHPEHPILVLDLENGPNPVIPSYS